MNSALLDFFGKQENYRWVVETCRQILSRSGSKDVDGGKDLANDVFLKLAEKENKIGFPKNVNQAKSFLLTTIKRTRIDRIRKQNIRIIDAGLAEDVAEDMNPCAESLIMTRLHFINELIKKKKKKFTKRQLQLWDFFFNGHSLESICSTLQKTNVEISKLKFKLVQKILKECRIELRSLG